MADRYQHVVELSALPDVVVDLVGGDDRRAAPLRDRSPAFEPPGIIWPQVMVELAEDQVLSQRLLQQAEASLVVGGAQIEKITAMRGDGLNSGPRLAFRLVLVG